VHFRQQPFNSCWACLDNPLLGTGTRTRQKPPYYPVLGKKLTPLHSYWNGTLIRPSNVALVLKRLAQSSCGSHLGQGAEVRLVLLGIGPLRAREMLGNRLAVYAEFRLASFPLACLPSGSLLTCVLAVHLCTCGWPMPFWLTCVPSVDLCPCDWSVSLWLTSVPGLTCVLSVDLCSYGWRVFLPLLPTVQSRCFLSFQDSLMTFLFESIRILSHSVAHLLGSSCCCSCRHARCIVAYINACTYIHIYICAMYVCMYVHTDRHIYCYTGIHTYIHSCTHAYLPGWRWFKSTDLNQPI